MRMQHPHRPNLRMVDLTRDEDVNMAVAGPSNAGNQAAAAAPLAPPAAAPDVNDAEFDRFQLTSLITNLYTGVFGHVSRGDPFEQCSNSHCFELWSLETSPSYD